MSKTRTTFQHFQVAIWLQAAEIWREHRDWIQQHKPQFGPGVKERFEMASQISQEVRAPPLCTLTLP